MLRVLAVIIAHTSTSLVVPPRSPIGAPFSGARSSTPIGAPRSSRGDVVVVRGAADAVARGAAVSLGIGNLARYHVSLRAREQAGDLLFAFAIPFG